MGVYRDHVVPRLVEVACGGAQMERWRARAAEGLHGRVVEIGFGSGLNVPVYPPEITEVLAVEPAHVARDRAAHRIAASPVPVRHVGLDGQVLPIDDHSCDGALSTFTLCTIPDAGAALAELRRVLKPGGELHLLEHGLSPDPKVARRQHRLDPIEQRVADGCHLTRDPITLVEAAGFEVIRQDRRYAKGPKPWTWMTSAVAVSP
ncbi:class I SAM-dependent methyltransferase [Aquihabitans sp. McL0605]|uniref:class I SAM-dependent methyltransferase n=1 Tax=Aquihabitans sp. McL0605 TaxID=3415671 RepID=UPI003CF0AF77